MEKNQWIEPFPIGTVKFIGKTGPRWIHGETYQYLGECLITDMDNEICAPSWPDYLVNNFVSLQQQRDDKLSSILQ